MRRASLSPHHPPEQCEREQTSPQRDEFARSTHRLIMLAHTPHDPFGQNPGCTEGGVGLLQRPDCGDLARGLLLPKGACRIHRSRWALGLEPGWRRVWARRVKRVTIARCALRPMLPRSVKLRLNFAGEQQAAKFASPLGGFCMPASAASRSRLTSVGANCGALRVIARERRPLGSRATLSIGLVSRLIAAPRLSG